LASIKKFLSPYLAVVGELMKAIQLLDNQQIPKLTEVDIPNPIPGEGELLIRVHAAGVTPTELLWYPTFNTKDGHKRIHAIPSHEFSGVIAGLGNNVECFEIGDEVYGMNDWFAQGAAAEYCITTPSSIARKPDKLSHSEAATVPIGALTAWQGLFDRARLQSSERVLVHGGSGAVGAFVIQLAKLHGADVIATASTRNKEFVISLGADEVIDYEETAFETAVGKVEVLFDCVGGDTLARSWNMLSPNGRAVTIAANSEGANNERIKNAFFIVEPKRQQLSDIGVLIDGGSLRPFVGAKISFEEAPAAYAGNIKRSSGHGKIVLIPDAIKS
jgi:NADPH:quinone reductase-like Zn-dependent oxidoreductase